MSEKILIVGDGAMGTVCGLILAENGHEVTMWSHQSEQTESLKQHRENINYLPGVALPDSMKFITGDDCLSGGYDWVVSAVPCKFLRSIWTKISGSKPDELAIMSITKGLENNTLARPTEIIESCVGKCQLAALSGPNIADELARQLPATTTIASYDDAFAQRLQTAFTNHWFRVYTNSDLIGVEFAGATKNVVAIAAGLIDGLKVGDNAKAALLTRGLVEITRLGQAMGAKAETFHGLSGMGDLVTTCISPSGRNRTFGQALASGKSVQEVLDNIAGEVEGVNTCKSLYHVAQEHHVEMPITHAVYRVLFENVPVDRAITELMTRKPKAETSS